MKFSTILHSIALATIAGTAAADGIQPYKAETIQPRNAETVQPRNAETIQPRNAATIQSRTADAVQPYRAPAATSTAVQGQSVSAWKWQKLANTGVAGGGLGRGTELSNIRCAGLSCSAYQDTGGGWVIRGEGGFPEIPGTMLDVRLMNLGTKKAQADTRRRGVFSDGSFWDLVDTYRLPAGSYAVFYVLGKNEQPFAAITFDLKRHADGGSSRPAAAKNAAGANQDLGNQWQKNALCLGAAAMNPDVRCVPAGQ